MPPRPSTSSASPQAPRLRYLTSQTAALKLQAQLSSPIAPGAVDWTGTCDWYRHLERMHELYPAEGVSPYDWSRPGYYNTRKSMRVLEDYLCAAILGVEDAPVYAPSRSLRAMIESGEYKDSLDKLMLKHGLTKYHFQVMRHMKKSGWLFPSRAWEELVRTSIRKVDSELTRNVKIHLFRVLSTFLNGSLEYNALKSPFYDDGLEDALADPCPKFSPW